MEEKQLLQINNLSKDELVERIKSHFNNQAKSSLILAILWGVLAILGFFKSGYSILLTCFWLLLLLMWSFQFLEYRKMSKEDSAKGLLTSYDKFRKRNLFFIPITILFLCIGIYEIFAEKNFVPNVLEWISLLIIGSVILFLAWYFFSSKFRTKIENSGSGNINRYVERLRELVEQEEGKSEENV